MTNYTISIDPQPAEADVRTLIRNLVAYNDGQAEKENLQRFAIFIRDNQETIIGGLYGYTHWGWLFVSHLWVSDLLRGQGYGKELVVQAEQEAIRRGCQHAYLDTYDFQALDFYQKQGYQLFGSLEDFPIGHTRYFLQKRELN